MSWTEMSPDVAVPVADWIDVLAVPRGGGPVCVEEVTHERRPVRAEASRHRTVRDRAVIDREICASPQFPKFPVCPEVFHQALPPATIVPARMYSIR